MLVRKTLKIWKPSGPRLLITLNDLAYFLNNDLPIDPEPECEFDWEQFLLKIQECCGPTNKIIDIDISRTRLGVNDSNVFSSLREDLSRYNTGEQYIRKIILPNEAEETAAGNTGTQKASLFMAFTNLEEVYGDTIRVIRNYSLGWSSMSSNKLKIMSFRNVEELHRQVFAEIYSNWDLYLSEWVPTLVVEGGGASRLFQMASHSNAEHCSITIHVPYPEDYELEWEGISELYGGGSGTAPPVYWSDEW
jgi:hypothetical protein